MRFHNAIARRSPRAATPLVATLLAAVLLAGCAADDADTGDADADAEAIVCSTAYRVSTSEPLTEVDTLRFEDEDSTQSLPYIYLELHGQFTTGATDGERALRLWVTPTAADQVLVTHLYQLAAGQFPSNQFHGGHGFTGLNYAYDPVSGAELQYWCEAE